MDIFGWSIAELERRAELSEGGAKNIIYGKSKNPRADTLKKIAKALGCTTNDLSRDDIGEDTIANTPDIPADAFGGSSDRILNGGMPITELDVRAGAGPGTLTEENTATHTWRVPTEVIRGYTSAPSEELKIITVYGDSMEPTLMPGQRIMVDIADRTPSPPGLFVVWDGLGLVVKRLQVIPHSDPVCVRISSDNPRYEPYERTLEEAHIQGRVIGGWRWM